MPESLRRAAELIGNFSDLLTPMMWEDRGVGMMTITREPNVDFSDKERALLKTFADQAVVAIENARLFNEVQRARATSEALEQQTATSEVLEVISSSPGELEPVFHKMLENATRVCGANFGIMNLWDGENFRTAAAYNVPPAFAALRHATPLSSRIRESPFTRSYRPVRSCIYMTSEASSGYLAGVRNAVEIADMAGARTIVIVPMLKEDELLGVDHDLSSGGPSLHRQADRAGREFHQAGRDRDREHAAASRIARAHRRSRRIAAAADGHAPTCSR